MEPGLPVETRRVSPRGGGGAWPLREAQPGQERGPGRGARQSALEGAAAHPCEQGQQPGAPPPRRGMCRGCAAAFLKPESPPRLAIRFATRSDGSRIRGSSRPDCGVYSSCLAKLSQRRWISPRSPVRVTHVCIQVSTSRTYAQGTQRYRPQRVPAGQTLLAAARARGTMSSEREFSREKNLAFPKHKEVAV